MHLMLQSHVQMQLQGALVLSFSDTFTAPVTDAFADALEDAFAAPATHFFSFLFACITGHGHI